MGLHHRYTDILGNGTLTLSAPLGEEEREALHKKFENMMSALFRQEGASLDINLLASDEAQDFIRTHATVLDNSFRQVEMSSAMRRHLTESDYVFSGLKTFHELNEAFPSLLDENGNKKPFERFLNDVRTVDETYNRNYLYAEYNFVQSAAAMAARWEDFEAGGGDRYNLQYRTMRDDKVRPEHAALDGTTLPPSDPFWDAYYPPNGWNCRCSVVQVRRSKYPETSSAEANRRGEEALKNDTRGMFRFNAGKMKKTMPDYNPYTIRRCRDCDIAKGKTKLAKFVPENELCQACKLLRHLKNTGKRRRLTSKERKAVQESAVNWANRHLPKVTMSDGTRGARLTIQTKEGVELHIGKKFFTETYSQCKNSRKVAETIEMATYVNEWIRDAEQIRIEPGRHHDFNFVVFKATYNNQDIEFKAKVTDGLIVYVMRLI